MELLLHPSVEPSLKIGRFAPGKTYLFVGQPGQGKAAAARELARQLNCLHRKEPCAHCRLFAAGNYPDFILVKPDGQSVKIEQVRELQQQLSLSPYQASSARFVVISSAELLTVEAQNALLKLIEEPPAQTSIILAASNPESLLPTVRSRAQAIFFPPVPTGALSEWLGRRGARPARELAELSDGAPGLALRLADDPDLKAAYVAADQQAKELLSAPLFKRLLLVKDLTAQQASTLVVERLLIAARSQARQGQLALMPAAERLARQLAANVSPRAALEAFVVGA